MTNDECRAEALRRVQESDRLFEYWHKLPVADPALYSEISQLRQTAVVYAVLAGPKDNRLGGEAHVET